MAAINIIMIKTPTLPSILDLGAILENNDNYFIKGGDNYRMQNAGGANGGACS